MPDYRALAVANLEQELYRLSVQLNELAEYEKPFFTDPHTGQKWETASYRASLSRRIDEIVQQVAVLRAPSRRVSYKRPI